MPVSGAITLYVSLLTFTLRIHPDRLDYVDQILGACVQILSGKTKLEDSKATKQIVALLSAPLEKYKDISTALDLPNYPLVMDHLDVATNKVMAMVIIQNMLKNSTSISTADKVEALFELIKGLMKDLDGTEADVLADEDFMEEHNSVARLIHMLHSNNPEELFKIISTVRNHILLGGPKRLAFTVPPLVFSALKTIETLSVSSPELALRLHLQCSEAAGVCRLEPVSYEFFTQACILYEEEITESKAQVTAIQLITGTLQRMNVFGIENRETLTHKATGYSAKLLKKPDQCRAVYACSHLFWANEQDGFQDGERVLVCLKRALRIANAAQQMVNLRMGSSEHVTLFIEILNKSELQSDATTLDSSVDAFFSRTLRYIEFHKQKGGNISEMYQQLKV